MKEMLDLIGAYIFVYVIHVYYAYVGCAWKKNKRRKKKSFSLPSSLATCIMYAPEFKNGGRQSTLFLFSSYGVVSSSLYYTRGYLWSSILFCGTTGR